MGEQKSFIWYDTQKKVLEKLLPILHYHRTFIQLMTGEIADLPYADIDSQRSCCELVQAIKYHKILGDRCGYRENERILSEQSGNILRRKALVSLDPHVALTVPRRLRIAEQLVIKVKKVTRERPWPSSYRIFQIQRRNRDSIRSAKNCTVLCYERCPDKLSQS